MAHSSWGSGWPNCQSGKIDSLVVRTADGGTVDFPGGCRSELEELLGLLLDESTRRGYRLKDGWCWGYACRPIKTPDGDFTEIPSNHSWGLAIDVNAPTNPFGGTSHDIPRWMADLFIKYGFGWGGDYSGTKDWMHFEFLGSVADAERQTERARADLGGDDMSFEEYNDGEKAYREKFKEKKQDPGPPHEQKPKNFKDGWNAMRFAASNPKSS